MATLDVTGVQVIVVQSGTVVTVPGGSFTTEKCERLEVPIGALTMTISPAQSVRCMLQRVDGSDRRDLQCFCTDEMRQAS